MKIFGKTLSYWKESIGGWLCGIIICVIIYFINPQYSNWKEFIKIFPTIGMCAFGFLLTLLSIILQGNNSTIEWMKSRTKLFSRFILYNKRIVILSFLLSLFSYFLGYFNFQWIKDYTCQQLNNFAERLLIGIFAGMLTCFIIDTIHFINVFYILIKEKNDLL